MENKYPKRKNKNIMKKSKDKDRQNKGKNNSENGENGTSGEVTKTCPEGKFLNPKTNRCKNLQEINETSTGKTVTTYNPETGEATTVKYCNVGYYLNEETNRCKKKKENKGEDYKLDVPKLGSEEKKEFVGLGSIIAVLVVGTGLVVFQFRKEIMKFLRGLNFRKKA